MEEKSIKSMIYIFIQNCDQKPKQVSSMHEKSTYYLNFYYVYLLCINDFTDKIQYVLLGMSEQRTENTI